MHLFVTLLAMLLALAVLAMANFGYQMLFSSVPDFDVAFQRTFFNGGAIVFAAILVIYFHVKFLRKKKKVPPPASNEETV